MSLPKGISKKTLQQYAGPIFILNFSFWMVLSWFFYPNYDWTSMSISQLGQPDENLIGWIFWSIGLSSTGLLQIPVVSFIKRSLLEVNKKMVRFGTFFLYLACLGAVGLGIIPQFSGQVFWILHIINSTLAFAGLYLGMWCLSIFLLKTDSNKFKALIPALFCFGTPIGFIITQGIRIFLGLPHITPIVILNFPVWEWMLLYGIFGAFVSFIYLIPQKN